MPQLSRVLMFDWVSEDEEAPQNSAFEQNNYELSMHCLTSMPMNDVY